MIAITPAGVLWDILKNPVEAKQSDIQYVRCLQPIRLVIDSGLSLPNPLTNY